MGQPRSRHNPGRLLRHLCILENRVDVIAFVGFGAAVAERNIRTHREHAKVGLDAAEEGCCRAGGVGHLVVDAICLRKVGICILVNNSGGGRFASHLRKSNGWKFLERQNFLFAAHVHPCCRLGRDRHPICDENYQIFRPLKVHPSLQRFVQDFLTRSLPELPKMFIDVRSWRSVFFDGFEICEARWRSFERI